MIPIEQVDAWEVLDSRGEPTVRTRVETPRGSGTFTVPSGASTGTHEAVEVRDGGERFGGRGVRDAVGAVRTTVAPDLQGRDVTAQRAIDARLRELDGTDDLSRLGANAVLGVSGAVAHAASDALDRPLFTLIAEWMSSRNAGPGRIPLPMVNLISGGLHAAGGIEVQDILAVPTGAASYPAAVETAWAVRRAVRDRIVDAGHRPLVADEGGFAPPLDDVETGFDLAMAGIGDAGFRPGDEVALAVDVAATHFYDARSGEYAMATGDRVLDAEDMVDRVESWVESWPIVSVEDPLAEDDWDAWTALAERIGDEVQLLADDLTTTNPARLQRAIEAGAADSVLVKPNQAGTMTRVVEVVELARDAGFATVVSARSGETCDTTIADLAVGLDAGQIKIGSLARSERLAKYNRLFEIDREHDAQFAADEL